MKIQSPWMGRIKGSAGNMTGCKVYDKNVMRAKAFEVTNPNTQAQQTQRGFFAELTATCTDFSEELLRALFPQKPKTMSRRNAISKQIAESYAINGVVKSIDYEDITTLGNASVMDFGTTSCTNSSGTITVALDASVKANAQYADNYMGTIVWNETKGQFVAPDTNINVQTGELSFSAPAGWENADAIHAIPFIMKEKKGSKVALVGFGTMSVTKRPARQ